MKEYLYPDEIWKVPCTLGSAIFLFVGFTLGFWVYIVFLTFGGGKYDPSPCHLCMVLIMFILGIWLHHTADAQKYFVLKVRKDLITDGLYSGSRNPNFLGELFILGAFAGRSMRIEKESPFTIYFIGFNLSHPMWWWPLTLLGIISVFLFYPSFLAKDRSMSRYKEWPHYASKTGAHLSFKLIAFKTP